MRNRHITRFGSPFTHSGALYFATDEEGLVQMDIDMKIEEMRAKGAVITPNIKSMVKNSVKRQKAEYHNKVNEIGIPKKLENLFHITKKSQVEKYSRQLVLSEYDLFLLIHNCNQIRFTHRSKFKQYIPDHLKVLDTDRAEMKDGNPKVVLKKIRSGLVERRQLHVHLFESGSNWHCFYFSHQDIDPADTNHWNYGCHLHYISHLWPNLNKRHIWGKFNQRFTEISGSLHIRFEPFDFPNPDEIAEGNLYDPKTRQFWIDIFNPNLSCGCGSVPLPVAHMATRGAWISKVSIPRRPYK